MIKIFFGVVGLLVFIFALNWTFNHVNPWLSIVLLLTGIFIVLKLIQNKIKK